MIKGNSTEYGTPAKVLHWLTVILVTLASILALWMPAQTIESEASLWLKLHLATGIALMVVFVCRSVWRLFDTTPPAPGKLSRINLLAFKATHLGLYVLIGAVLLSGASLGLSLTCSLFPFDLGETLEIGRSMVFLFHKANVLFLWLLIFGHVAGVIHYQILKGDVLHKMGIQRFQRTDP